MRQDRGSINFHMPELGRPGILCRLEQNYGLNFREGDDAVLQSFIWNNQVEHRILKKRLNMEKMIWKIFFALFMQWIAIYGTNVTLAPRSYKMGEAEKTEAASGSISQTDTVKTWSELEA